MTTAALEAVHSVALTRSIRIGDTHVLEFAGQGVLMEARLSLASKIVQFVSGLRDPTPKNILECPIKEAAKRFGGTPIQLASDMVIEFGRARDKEIVRGLLADAS